MLWLRKPVKGLGGGGGGVIERSEIQLKHFVTELLVTLQQHKLRPLAKTCCATSGVIVHTKGREIEEEATERKRLGNLLKSSSCLKVATQFRLGVVIFKKKNKKHF